MSATTKRIVILGAASAMAEAAARLWAAQGASLALVGRNAERLETIAADLRLRGAAVTVEPADCDTVDAAATLDALANRLGGIDVVLLAYGILGDQSRLESDPAATRALLHTNFVSAAGWCMAAADRFERQRSGALIVIGSVAGDRGRASNYVYGASKAGVEGLAHRLAKAGARAALIKPGFVDTPMTAHIAKKGPLWAQPEALGRAIVRAAEKGGPVSYAPVYWRGIMAVIRNVPAPLFHRTNL